MVTASSVVLRDTTLTKGSKGTSPTWGQRHATCLPIQHTENTALRQCDFTKRAPLEPHHKKTLDKPKLKDCLRKNGPILFKNVKVTKGKDGGTVSGQRGRRQYGWTPDGAPDWVLDQYFFFFFFICYQELYGDNSRGKIWMRSAH